MVWERLWFCYNNICIESKNALATAAINCFVEGITFNDDYRKFIESYLVKEPRTKDNLKKIVNYQSVF